LRRFLPGLFQTNVTQLGFSPDVSEFFAVSEVVSKLRFEETQDARRGVQGLREFVKVDNLTIKHAKHSAQSHGSIPDSFDTLLLRKARSRMLFECFFHSFLLTAIMSDELIRASIHEILSDNKDNKGNVSHTNNGKSRSPTRDKQKNDRARDLAYLQ
jgi:hypothetical protein